MGAFYVNYTIKNADQKSVVRALAKRKAFVSPERNGALVAFDQVSDSQDEKVIAKIQLNSRLSEGRPAFLNPLDIG